MMFDLTFEFQGQIQGQRRGAGYRREITSAGAPKWSQMIVRLPQQLTQTSSLTWHLNFKVRFKVKARDTGYRPGIT